MKIVLYLGIVVSLIFLIPQCVDAITITAIPRTTHFGPNDWLYIDLKMDGYIGGTMNWTAHRPDKSMFSGSLDQFVSGNKTHQINRNAFDNYFGNWTIYYTYKNVTQPTSFVVDPIILSVKLDKGLYYDGDAMKINITTSYYLPDAAKAEDYHLNFYNNKGNLTKGVKPVNFKAYQPSMRYDFLIDELVRDNPLGKYKVVVQYYNVFAEAPFEVGDIEKRMTIFVGTDKSVYSIGDRIDLNLIFSKVRESQGVLEITDPLGNTTTSTFPVTSVTTKLHLENATIIAGKYRLGVHYAGATQIGSFNVESTSAKIEPNIVLELSLNKQEYRPGEIINAEIHTTSLIANSLSFWFEEPSGKQGSKLSIPITSGDTVIPHKIKKDDMQGAWKMYIDYGNATRYAIFFVKGEPVDSTNIITSDIIDAPKLLLTLGLGTDVKFKNPRGIAIDSEDNIYVVDSGNSQIKKFDSTGKFLLLWGSFGTEYGQFKNPTGIFADQNYVYITDTGNARIQKFDKNGNFVYVWGAFGDEPGMFRTPVALAASKLSDFFVSDAGQNKILIFDSNGKYKDVIRSPLTAVEKFSSTNYIIFDSKNNFYVVSDDNKVLQFSEIGTFLKSFGTTGEKDGQFNKPSAIAIDSRGNLYVTDTENHRVQKFDSYGKFLVSWGSLGTGPVQFKEPVGIAVDSKNNVYVVDRANNNVQKFAPYSASGDIVIPEWVRNTARWWAQDAILDSDFVTGIQYMIKQKIIKVPKEESITTGSNVTIPPWIKINAGWWSDKKISDKDFAAGIQYLVSRGIIKI